MPPPTLASYAAYAEERDRRQPRTGEGPLVSVVTVALNAEATLERTIRSVQAQMATSIEQVFVDGGSTDGTLAMIERMARPGDYRVSERDRGISDAFNKGIALSRGRYVAILNADDWHSPDQVEQALRVIETSGADFAFGDVVFYEDGRPFFTYVGDPNYARVIERRMPTISHTTVLARRHCFERVGLFDLTYRNAMDYDWLLRLHRGGLRGAYCSAIIGHMTHDGVSNRQFRRTVDEVRRIAVAHGRNPIAAQAEAWFQSAKISVSQPIKAHASPLYLLVRRMINSSFRPVSAQR